MILYRCFAWNDRARQAEPDGPLWYPRVFQGEGRHDNPDVYGCLYLADRAVSCVVEQLARFRTQRLTPALLRRRGLPLAIVELELAERAELLDLDDPTVLRRERLRPSLVATRERAVTQPQVRRLYETHAKLAGVRWWSTYEAQWANVTVFERAARMLRAGPIRALTVEDPVMVEAADFFGMRAA